MLKKIAVWAVAIVIVVWIISAPAKAGATVHGWIVSILDFFSHLANG